MSPFITALLVLVATFLVADRLTWLMIRLAPRLGLIDHPGERRIHEVPMPRAGGIAIFLAFLAGGWMMTASGLPYAFHSNLSGAHLAVWPLVGAALLVGMGVIDDRFNIRALWKLVGQVVVASVVFFGTQTEIGMLMGVHVPWWIDYGVYVVWMVALINAFNLIDGMDGLCAGLGLIAVGILCLLSCLGPFLGETLILAVMCVVLLAFLRHNFYPAKIFLGDAGSMFIGFFIATAGNLTVGRRAAVAGLLLPLLVAGVPLFDVLLAIWRRSARKLSHSGAAVMAPKIFGADRHHLHHRLLSRGLTQRQAAGAMYALAVSLSLLALIPIFGGTNLLSFSLVGLIMIGLVGLRYIAPIEFIASSDGLRAVLLRPMKRSMVMLVYYTYDLIVLISAGWFAIWLVEHATMTHFSKSDYLMVISVFVGCSMLGLSAAGAHLRRWSRAGIHDFLACLMWLTCGIILSLALITTFLEDLSFRMTLIHLTAFGLALWGLMLPRCFGKIIKVSAMSALHRNRSIRNRTGRRALLYGAGNLGELFVSHLLQSPSSRWSEYSFVGFLDDQENLRGLRMRGFPILGTMDRLDRLVAIDRIGCVIITTRNLSPARRRCLLDKAKRLGLGVLEWCPEFGLVPLDDHEGIVNDATTPDLH